MPDIRPNRLSREEIAQNFSDLHPPLSRSEALVEADRCYFCFDAPCTTACPTDIDIPGFIQKIRSGNLRGSAHTILSENIMGGMCARVCPTEVLCEQACVRNDHEDKPARPATRGHGRPVVQSGDKTVRSCAQRTASDGTVALEHRTGGLVPGRVAS